MVVTLKDMIEQFKQKDYQSFDFFYEKTKRKVFFAVINIIKDESLVDDIMQDTYLKFLKNIEFVKSDKNVHGYLIMIARNLAIDMYRVRKKEVFNEDIILNTPDEPEQVEDDDIFKILEVLDDIEKEVVTLHVINDMKFREISNLLEKPLGTILWIYQKAMKKLKREVGDGDEQ